MLHGLVVAALMPVVAAQAEAPKAAALLDLNRASIAELVALPGIGEKRAAAIVALRVKRPFRHTADLMRIKGVGRKLYRKLRPFVRVEPPSP